MSSDISAPGTSARYGGQPTNWVRLLPDGAVSVNVEANEVVLRASQGLQQRFEQLLERRKTGSLTADETDQYKAICELDDKLSWLNRLARTALAQTAEN